MDISARKNSRTLSFRHLRLRELALIIIIGLLGFCGFIYIVKNQFFANDVYIENYAPTGYLEQ